METHNKHTKTHACDLVERQAVIDAANDADVIVFCHDDDPIDEAIEEAILATKRSIVKSIEELPSAQPDIIRCKDCINRQGDYCHCSTGIVQYGTYVKESDYCSKGVRREE